MDDFDLTEQKLRELYEGYAKELAACDGDQQCVDYTLDKYYNIFKAYLTVHELGKYFAYKNWDYFSPVARTVKGIMLYSIENDCESVEEFINKYYNLQYLYCADNLCVHAVIDGHSGKYCHVLPWDWKGSHCEGDMDETHIAVVMWLPLDSRKNGEAMVKKAWDSAVNLCAMLCNRYSLDPVGTEVNKDGGTAPYVIISQAEGRKNFEGCYGSNDPERLWTRFDSKEYNMEQFRKSVQSCITNKNVLRYRDLFMQNQ